MPRKNILTLLEGGDRRSIGGADQLAAIVSRNRKLFSILISGPWAQNPLVRMRAMDAAEKITRTHPEWLLPYKKKLLGLLIETHEQELRWHLAVMIPRLRLNPNERRTATTSLTTYLKDRSSIVKTFALQGLADLTENEPRLRLKVIETLREATRNGTPAMKARGRKLLIHLERT
jgi:hypothetical protein